jgi:Tfp pilus assembly protein PilO
MKGKRGPIFAGVGVAALAILLFLFLVSPKMGEVSQARTELEDARNEQQTLESQLSALEDARNGAGEARQIIAEVDRQIPPTADLPGLILLLQNAAVGSGLDLVTVTPGTPAFNATSGLSAIPVTVNGTGSYFDVAEFLFRIETLPRAAKTLTVTLAPGGGDDEGTTTTTTIGSPELTMTASVELYTSDTSAGPGSIPGPTTEAPPEAGG